MSTKRPANEHMSEYHKGLIDKVPDCDLMNLLKEQTPAFVNFIEGIPPEQSAEIHYAMISIRLPTSPSKSAVLWTAEAKPVNVDANRFADACSLANCAAAPAVK